MNMLFIATGVAKRWAKKLLKATWIVRAIKKASKQVQNTRSINSSIFWEQQLTKFTLSLCLLCWDNLGFDCVTNFFCKFLWWNVWKLLTHVSRKQITPPLQGNKQILLCHQFWIWSIFSEEINRVRKKVSFFLNLLWWMSKRTTNEYCCKLLGLFCTKI